MTPVAVTGHPNPKYESYVLCVSGGDGATEEGGAGSVCWSSEGSAGADSEQSGKGTERDAGRNQHAKG